MLGRGRYGVEWTKHPEDREFSGLVRIGIVIAVLSSVSLTWTLVKRVRARVELQSDEQQTEQIEPAVDSSMIDLAPVEPLDSSARASLSKRPAKLRNLLMRLDEAEKRRDIEMAIATIESIRGLPGSPAADLDNALARRLGDLNIRRLFVLKSAQWVATVVVKKGDTASRIASEHGSTLASLAKLSGVNVETIRVGQQLKVLDHPRFNLAVHRRTRMADLFLNGKFFKRYDLTRESGVDGSHEVTMPIREFWGTIRVAFSAKDREELELLLPKGASVLVSEI